MSQITATELEVLDATADDLEDLEQIYLSVRHHSPSPARLPEVADAVRSLVERGLLVARMGEAGGPPKDDLSYVWSAWFEMTPQGRAVWGSTAPAVDAPTPGHPADPAQPAPANPSTNSGASDAARPAEAPRRRSLYGLWKEYNIDLRAEDLAEVRREMWRDFPKGPSE